MRQFYVLLAGLSADSMFRRVAGRELAIIDDPDRIQAALRG